MLGGGSESEPAPSRMLPHRQVATAGQRDHTRRAERTNSNATATSAGSPA